MAEDTKRQWHKALEHDEIADGRVKSVTCGLHRICMSRFEGQYAAMSDHCPHQGGPLGEGSIENGWLRCPWHGWDFHPLTGKSPGGYDDGVPAYPVEVRDDGVYVGVPEQAEHVQTTSDVLIETMVNWGVTAVFGMVGHSNLGIADAMRLQEEAGRLRYIAIRHEGAGAFAASAYGKLTGRPAACFAIAGPGATNMLTGLWDAHVDRSPTLAITGQVPTKLIGRGAFQEVDLVAAYGQVAQWAIQSAPDSNHAELMTLACKSAILNRGVSHIVVPDDVASLPYEDGKADEPAGRITPMTIAPPGEQLDSAVEKIKAAQRPVIICGHGARFCMDEVRALAHELKAPVLTTFKAKGVISDKHPSGCGVLGRSGTPIASWFMNESDLLIVLGASFSNHTGITPKKPIIQVDYDPMMLGRFHKVDIPVWGDIGVTAAAILERVAGQHQARDQRLEIAERWALWRAEKHQRLQETGSGIGSPAVFAALTRQVPGDAIIAVDVGNNTYSFGRYFECDRQSVLMSGYLGSIGFGFPAAMGAWVATQESDEQFAGRKVVSISGDGGFGQYLGDFTTAVKYGMNITHVLLNNSELGKISKEQRAGHWHVWQTALHNPNFAEFAESCGAWGRRVTSDDDLDNVLAEALSQKGPALVEIMTDALLV